MNDLVALVDVVEKNKFLVCASEKLSSGCEYANSVEQAVFMIAGAVNHSKSSSSIPDKFLNMAVRAVQDVESANNALRKFTLTIQARWKSNAANQNICMISLGDDLLSLIIRNCEFASIAAAKRTCKTLSELNGLESLLPHLSIRWNPTIGYFPHKMLQNSQVGVVFKSHVVRIAIDIAVESHSHMLNTVAVTGDNFGYGDYSGESAEYRRSARRDIDECRNRNLGQHTVEGTASRATLNALRFFSGQPKCRIELVYADTNERVACHDSAFVETHRSFRHVRRLFMHTSKFGVPFPAWTDVLLNRVSSSDDEDRAYKFRVTVEASVGAFGTVGSFTQTLITYSRPFIVLSSPRSSLKRKSRQLAKDVAYEYKTNK
jgi:hypothetical protein